MEASEFVNIKNVRFLSSWSFRPEDREIVVTQTFVAPVDQVIIPSTAVEIVFDLAKLI
jgi:hypothetical protein